MKIGIDIDGVLTDITSFCLEYGAKFAFNNKLKGIVNPNTFEVRDILGLSEEET